MDSCPPATSVVNSSRVTSERFLSGNPPDQYTMMTWPRRGKHGEAVRDGHDAQTGLPGRRGVIHGALIVRVQPEMSLVNVDLSAPWFPSMQETSTSAPAPTSRFESRSSFSRSCLSCQQSKG